MTELAIRMINKEKTAKNGLSPILILEKKITLRIRKIKIGRERQGSEQRAKIRKITAGTKFLFVFF